MKYFGVLYDEAEAERVDTPVGAHCARCGESVSEWDDGFVLPPNEAVFHAACFMRGVVGSMAHQQKRCSCFVPDSTEDDDPALTRRKAAEAAVAYFYSKP